MEFPPTKMRNADFVTILIAGIDILPEASSAKSKQTKIHQQGEGPKRHNKKLIAHPLANREDGAETASAGHRWSWCIGEEFQQKETKPLGAAYLETEVTEETLVQLDDEQFLHFRVFPGCSALFSPGVWRSREPDGPQDGRGTPGEQQGRPACGA